MHDQHDTDLDQLKQEFVQSASYFTEPQQLGQGHHRPEVQDHAGRRLPTGSGHHALHWHIRWPMRQAPLLWQRSARRATAAKRLR